MASTRPGSGHTIQQPQSRQLTSHPCSRRVNGQRQRPSDSGHGKTWRSIRFVRQSLFNSVRIICSPKSKQRLVMLVCHFERAPVIGCRVHRGPFQRAMFRNGETNFQAWELRLFSLENSPGHFCSLSGCRQEGWKAKAPKAVRPMRLL